MYVCICMYVCMYDYGIYNYYRVGPLAVLSGCKSLLLYIGSSDLQPECSASEPAVVSLLAGPLASSTNSSDLRCHVGLL